MVSHPLLSHSAASERQVSSGSIVPRTAHVRPAELSGAACARITRPSHQSNSACSSSVFVPDPTIAPPVVSPGLHWVKVQTVAGSVRGTCGLLNGPGGSSPDALDRCRPL